MARGHAFGSVSGSVLGRVNARRPRWCRVGPRSPRGVPDRASDPRSRELTASGCTSFVRMAEVGSTHRASSALGGRKASWGERALAGRKLEAASDARHGWRDGETVRGRGDREHVIVPSRPPGASSEVQDTTEGALGLPSALLNPQTSRGPWLTGQTSVTRSARVAPRGSGSGGSETDSDVLVGDDGGVRGRRGTVKAPRRRKRPRGVRILGAEKAPVERCAGPGSAEAGGSE